MWYRAKRAHRKEECTERKAVESIRSDESSDSKSGIEFFEIDEGGMLQKHSALFVVGNQNKTYSLSAVPSAVNMTMRRIKALSVPDPSCAFSTIALRIC